MKILTQTWINRGYDHLGACKSLSLNKKKGSKKQNDSLSLQFLFVEPGSDEEGRPSVVGLNFGPEPLPPGPREDCWLQLQANTRALFGRDRY